MIERLVGMQAQVPSNPYVALWARLRDFDPAELSDLIASRAAVRAQLMRSTIHLVTARDALALHGPTAPVLARTFAGLGAVPARHGGDRRRPRPCRERVGAVAEARSGRAWSSRSGRRRCAGRCRTARTGADLDHELAVTGGRVVALADARGRPLGPPRRDRGLTQGTTIGLTLSGSSRPTLSAASASSSPKRPEMIALRSTARRRRGRSRWGRCWRSGRCPSSRSRGSG